MGSICQIRKRKRRLKIIIIEDIAHVSKASQAVLFHVEEIRKELNGRGEK